MLFIQVYRMSRRALTALCASLLFLANGGAGAAQQRLGRITTPETELGFEIGADYRLADYTQLMAYWAKLARESDRMVLDTIGQSEEGRPQLMAIITAPDNHRRLARYREIARRLARAEPATEEEAWELASEGKAVVWIDGGLHADEVLGAQQLMQLVYDMVSLTDSETLRFLSDVILLAVHANPDGMELVTDWYMREPDSLARTTSGLPVLYQEYAGHDNNRDFFMANLAETENMNRVAYTEWFPQIVYNHHQTGPEGTVMFSPPFRDPPNYNIHPLVLTSVEQVGGHMHARFVREGKGGVTTRSGTSYSTWWNGGLRTTPYFHNMIGLLTETIGHPTPMEIPFLPEKQLPSHDLPMPVEPGVWRFKWSVDYSQTANRTVLDFASRNPELLLLNIWRMGRDAIERGRRDSWSNTPQRIYAAQRATQGRGTRADFERLLRRPQDRLPRGFILPSDQADFNTAIKFVNTLLKSGIDVQRASAAFTVNGRRYAAGSLVVKTDQAFAPHVLDMFEPQDHPNDFTHPGGPPIRPYDLTGYTLAYQMGVQFDRVLEGFDGPFKEVSAATLAPEPGLVRGSGQGGFLLDHRVNDAFKVVNRLLADGSEVHWVEDPIAVDGVDYPAGAFYVAAAPGVRPLVEQLASELGVDAHVVARRPEGETFRLSRPRIGLFDEYGGSITSGWTRYVLEDFGFEFSLVFPPELDEGNLNAKYDVLVFPDGAIPEPGSRILSYADTSMTRARTPAQYRPRLGTVTAERTIPAILDFVRRGGVAVTVGGSTSLAAHAGLPVSNHLVGPDGREYSEEEFYIPGSLLELELWHGRPTLHGMGPRATVVYNQSPVLRIAPGASDVVVLGSYGRSPLRSGWAWGQERLAGGVALAEATLGRGRVFLFTTDVTFRGQPHGTFLLLFNAIHFGARSVQAGDVLGG